MVGTDGREKFLKFRVSRMAKKQLFFEFGELSFILKCNNNK